MIWSRLDWSPELAALLPVWMRGGAFGLLPLAREAWDRLPRRSKTSRAWLRSRQGDERELLGRIGWLLEPPALLSGLVQEAGRLPRRVLPPLPMPAPLRRWRAALERGRLWMDPSASADALAVLVEASGEDVRGIFPVFEPEHGELIVCLSHEADVRSLDRGGAARRLLLLERRHGFASTWFIRLGWRRPDFALLDPLRDEGHELGWTDASPGRGLPFVSPQAMRRRIDSSQPFLERYGVRGSRSPGFLRTPAYFHCMARHFAYDSSRHDGRPPGQGSGTCRPFWDMGGLLQLPVGLSLAAGGDGPEAAERLLSALEHIRRRRGVAVVSSPALHEGPQAESVLRTYGRFLDGLAAMPGCRRMLMRDVSETCARTAELKKLWREGVQGGRG